MAAPDAFFVVADKPAAVMHLHRGFALLLAHVPLPRVHRVFASQDAAAMRVIARPGALVNGAVVVVEGAVALGAATAELAAVHAAVGPHHCTLAVGLAIQPLARIPAVLTVGHLTLADAPHLGAVRRRRFARLGVSAVQGLRLRRQRPLLAAQIGPKGVLDLRAVRRAAPDQHGSSRGHASASGRARRAVRIDPGECGSKGRGG
mmetsp:Transcript_86133/g.238720  ORF Transcript_86133/g.238720 Transcript_86133/m.238720 type:complete len:204 (+) Transcript_86133:501-1112(+)